MLKNIFGSDLSRNLFRLALWGAGLASISMIVWTLGPLIDIGGYRPLQNSLARQAVILIIAAAVAGGVGFGFHRRKKSSEQLAEGIGSAAPVERDEDIFRGYPLAVYPSGAATVFYGIWPAAMTAVALVVNRRQR